MYTVQIQNFYYLRVRPQWFTPFFLLFSPMAYSQQGVGWGGTGIPLSPKRFIEFPSKIIYLPQVESQLLSLIYRIFSSHACVLAKTSQNVHQCSIRVAYVFPFCSTFMDTRMACASMYLTIIKKVPNLFSWFTQQTIKDSPKFCTYLVPCLFFFGYFPYCKPYIKS